MPLSNIVVAGGNVGNVIKVGGDCYQFIGLTTDPVDASADSVHTDCDDCAASSTCPSDCTNCDTPITVDVTGFTGGCADLNGSYTLTKAGCSWTGPCGDCTDPHDMDITCVGNAWVLTLTGNTGISGSVVGSKANQVTGTPGTGPCVREGLYALAGGTGDCAGQTGEALVS